LIFDYRVTVSDTLKKAYERVRDCECENGCGRCIESPSCKEGNLVSSKIGALIVLAGVLDIMVDETRLPPLRQDVYPDVHHEYGTIVEAQGVGVMEGVEVEKD
jgi:DEAD/DEAH box helicase domain-containing protein